MPSKTQPSTALTIVNEATEMTPATMNKRRYETEELGETEGLRPAKLARIPSHDSIEEKNFEG